MGEGRTRTAVTPSNTGGVPRGWSRAGSCFPAEPAGGESVSRPCHAPGLSRIVSCVSHSPEPFVCSSLVLSAALEMFCHHGSDAARWQHRPRGAGSRGDRARSKRLLPPSVIFQPLWGRSLCSRLSHFVPALLTTAFVKVISLIS